MSSEGQGVRAIMKVRSSDSGSGFSADFHLHLTLTLTLYLTLPLAQTLTRTLTRTLVLTQKKRNASLEKDIRTTLVPGVRPSRTPGRWEASLTIRGAGSSGYIYLGTFSTLEKASEVRLWAVQMTEKNGNVDAKTMKELIRDAFPECFSKSKKPITFAPLMTPMPVNVHHSPVPYL